MAGTKGRNPALRGVDGGHARPPASAAEAGALLDDTNKEIIEQLQADGRRS